MSAQEARATDCFAIILYWINGAETIERAAASAEGRGFSEGLAMVPVRDGRARGSRGSPVDGVNISASEVGAGGREGGWVGNDRSES